MSFRVAGLQSETLSQREEQEGKKEGEEEKKSFSYETVCYLEREL